jgi:hypothetical protein
LIRVEPGKRSGLAALFSKPEDYLFMASAIKRFPANASPPHLGRERLWRKQYPRYPVFFLSNSLCFFIF